MVSKKLPTILEPEEAQNLLKQPNKRYAVKTPIIQ
jgi:hypothetical protein